MVQPSLHLWTTGLFDFKGGIQTFSSFFQQALQDIHPDVHQGIFLLHDRKIPQEINISQNQSFRCSGNIPASVRIAAFAAQLFCNGWLERPELIIATHLNLISVAYWLNRFAQIPYWTVAHGFEAWDIQKPALQQAILHADRILAVSRYTRNCLLEKHAIPPERVQLLPNTFDANRFQVAEKPDALLRRYGLCPDQPVILTVNRLAPGEDFHPYDQVLAALPQIRAAIPQVHYLIVGKGGDRPRLEQVIAEQALQDCVTLAGFVPDAELGAHYNLCDVYAMPSTLEGFGIVFLEALASGKPVLAGNQDGSVDALCDGKLGALVHPKDVDAIADTLVRILQRTYANPLMFQPAALRQAVIEQFGFEQFRQTLANHLHTSPLNRSSVLH